MSVTPSRRVCSECGERARSTSQRWCHKCANAYMRQGRRPYAELSEEQRRKANARAYANVYQRRGLLVPQPCELGGPDCDGPIEKHHDDYNRPLDVRWLCRGHHRALDRDNRNSVSRENAA